MDCSLPILHLDLAIEDVQRLANLTWAQIPDNALSSPYSSEARSAQSLLEELLHTRQRYGQIIDGKKKPRGKQAGRRMILMKLKYASAWAFEFITREWEKEPNDRYVPLQKAEARYKEEAGRRCYDAIEMAAFLVLHAFRDERQKHAIKNPWDNSSDFSGENYARRYINTEAGRRIGARIHRDPTLLFPRPVHPLDLHDGDDVQKVWKSACRNGRHRNPLLQKIFSSWY